MPGKLPNLGPAPQVAAATFLVLGLLVGAAYLDAQQREHRSAQEQGRAKDLARQQREAVRLARLGAQVRDLRRRVADRTEVEQRVGEVQRAVAEVKTSVLRRLPGEVERSLDRNPDLLAARKALSRIERADAAAERIIARYSPAICILQGAYGFGRSDKGTGFRFLREATPDLLGGIEVSADKIPLTVEGNGERFTVEYTGTAFLVDKSGILITNRHIAQPWWKSASAAPLMGDGYEPRLIYMRVYFPGTERAVPIDTARILISDGADLAALRFRPFPGQPAPLPLAGPGPVAAGQPVVLFGFPSGLDALLARAGEGFAKRMEAEGELDPTAMLLALARRGLIRPLPTQGHIGDVMADRILFDAATAVGGSGGPLVDLEGRVVAINYGILRAFRGANFAVPARFAADLLAKARENR